MRVLINGKPVDALTAKQERELILSRTEEAVQGSVLPADQATDTYIRQTKRLFVILGSIGIVLILGISIAGAISDEMDGWLIAPAGVVIAGALALFIFLLLRHRIRVWNRGLAHRLEGLAPAGTAIAIDANGLSVAAEAFAWPSLAIELVEVTRFSTSSGEQTNTSYIIDRLSLAASTRVIVLDKAMTKNGPLIVDNVWRRMRPAAS